MSRRRRAARPAAPAVLTVLVLAGSLAASPAAASVAPGPRVERVTVLQDPDLDESSGLLVRGDDVLTVNDSGDGAVVYVVDATTGETVGRTTYTSDEVVDVEALAPAPGGGVWVADTGDNDRVRPRVSVYRLPPVQRGDRTVTAQRFDLTYPDGPQDAETLLVDPDSGRLFLVTKALFTGRVMAAPERLDPDGPNRLRPVGSVGGLVTDGAWLPEGSVVLRDYGDAFVLDPDGWSLRGEFPLPSQEQGEGIAPWRGGRVLVSSEGERQPLLAVRVPPALLAPEPEESGASRERSEPSTSERPETAAEAGEPTTITLGPAVAGGAVVAALTLLGFWVLRRRVRRGHG